MEFGQRTGHADENDEQIGDGQIEQEHVGWGGHASVAADDVDDQDIANDSQDEDKSVEDADCHIDVMDIGNLAKRFVRRERGDDQMASIADDWHICGEKKRKHGEKKESLNDIYAGLVERRGQG